MTVIAHGWRPAAAVPGGVHFSFPAAEAAAEATGCQPPRLGDQVSLHKPELYLPERCQHQDSDLECGVASEHEKRMEMQCGQMPE